MAIGKDADESVLLLATLPPTRQQRRLALAVGAGLIILFVAVLPFVAVPVAQLPIGLALVAVFVLSDLVTAVLLFSQFSIIRSDALLVLASGYLFAALNLVPFALTYPGLFSPTGLLGAGLQTPGWLYLVGHFSFPATVLGYAYLKGSETGVVHISARSAIGWSVAIVLGTVCAFTLLFTAGHDFVPRVALTVTELSPLVLRLGIFLVFFCACVFTFLWIRQQSILDQWLLVALLAILLETLMANVLGAQRWTVGSYTGFALLVLNSTVLLVVLLAETTSLYARIARSNFRLERERDNKLMTLEALAGSIAHEVKQPLSVIGFSGQAALHFLAQTPPDAGGAASSIRKMLDASEHADQALDNTRGLFGTKALPKASVDLSGLVLEVLHAVETNVQRHGIRTTLELPAGLPLVLARKGQLAEVISNLINNAVEAMAGIDDGVLKIKTEVDGARMVILSVEDTGPGISSEMANSIFEPFVTTKSGGMGLGLAICRMIVERHDGQLSVASAAPHGAIFRVALPSG